MLSSQLHPRRVAPVLALLALSTSSFADSDEFSAEAHLECQQSTFFGSTTLTLRSPLLGATAFIAADSEVGPLFLGDPDTPAFKLSADYMTLGAGTIDATGRFQVTFPSPPVLSGVFFQAVVLDQDGGLRVSNSIYIEPGHAIPAFTDITGLLDPIANFSSSDVDFGDLDKDGCPDAVIAGFDRPVLLWGDCTGSLAFDTGSRLPREVRHATSTVEIADVNNDSWLDIFVGGGFDPRRPLGNQLLINDGKGGFLLGSGFEVQGDGFIGLGHVPGSNGTAHVPPGRGVAIDAEFGDVDGDGDMDLVVTSIQDPDHLDEEPDPPTLYINQGGMQGGQIGRFEENEAFGDLPDNVPHVNSGDTSLADVDNDGDLDIFSIQSSSSTGGAQPRLFVNDGLGNFVDATDSALPSTLDKGFEAVFGDFDGDGDLDIFVANNLFGDSVNVNYYENVTTSADSPVFTDASSKLPSDLGPTTSIRIAVEAGDIDADGDLDVLMGIHELPTGAGPVTEGRTKLLVNQGGIQLGILGTFLVDPAFQPDPFIVADIALEDLDLDGDLDVYLANSGNIFQTNFADRLLRNDL